MSKKEKIAFISQCSLSEIIEKWLSLKILNNDKDLFYLSKNNSKTILELMDYLSQDEKKELLFLDKVFNNIYQYEIKKDTENSIPVIIKELFVDWWNINNVDKEIIKDILSSTFIPLDIINWDTLVLLSRTPEFKDDYKDILKYIMKVKKTKNIKLLLTTKKIFDFYKNSLIYNEISDEL